MKNQLLLPFSGLYGLITDVRNWLFDNQLRESFRPAISSVSVGNLTVGGTGKTPLIEFLIQWYLASGGIRPYETATLSRGYGRRTGGFRIATETDTAATIGDEPLQIYRKFGKQIRVCVGERRADAIRKLTQIHPDTRLILLDDAFQHRAVSPSLNLLLMDYNRPFYTDHPFPAGRLRERRHGAYRADAVVVTKCPLGLPPEEQRLIEERIRAYTHPGTPIFFAGLRYGAAVLGATHQAVESPDRLGGVVLVSGLANANPLEAYVGQTYALRKHLRFADHYAYTRSDFERLLADLPAGAFLLTTEKDWVKLDPLLRPDERVRLPLYYLPVAVRFLAGSDQRFEQFLQAALLKNG